jgi:ribonucleoside-diphosphate reductase alpha chain
MGLKTTYYLRTLAASQVEKAGVETAVACSITDPNCEACQ